MGNIINKKITLCSIFFLFSYLFLFVHITIGAPAYEIWCPVTDQANAYKCIDTYLTKSSNPPGMMRFPDNYYEVNIEDIDTTIPWLLFKSTINTETPPFYTRQYYMLQCLEKSQAGEFLPVKSREMPGIYQPSICYSSCQADPFCTYFVQTNGAGNIQDSKCTLYYNKCDVLIVNKYDKEITTANFSYTATFGQNTVECKSNNECTTVNKPICDPLTHTCEKCSYDSECLEKDPSKPKCDLVNGSCVDCKLDADCSAGQVCTNGVCTMSSTGGTGGTGGTSGTGGSLETNCTDGIDNDGDGQVDCSDSSCSTSSACNNLGPESNCTDGIDDDNDGQIDCGDSDCISNMACLGATVGASGSLETNCSDNTDNDGDGQIDCADPDCASNNACNNLGPETNCTDGSDDDNDGKVDCGDSDCASDSACFVGSISGGCISEEDCSVGQVCTNGICTISSTGGVDSANTCGNGEIDTGEECDLGSLNSDVANLQTGQGCTTQCKTQADWTCTSTKDEYDTQVTRANTIYTELHNAQGNIAAMYDYVEKFNLFRQLNAVIKVDCNNMSTSLKDPAGGGDYVVNCATELP